MKERFMIDLKKINEMKSGPEKKDALLKIVNRLNDRNVLSGKYYSNKIAVWTELLNCFR